MVLYVHILLSNRMADEGLGTGHRSRGDKSWGKSDRADVQYVLNYLKRKDEDPLVKVALEQLRKLLTKTMKYCVAVNYYSNTRSK